MAVSSEPFSPALIVVDVQNDFCPPHGSLAVPQGRSIAPVINHLLTLPFTLRIATKDFHLSNHISFAANHPPPNNKPFESTITIANPYNADEKSTTLLWPVHCVQGTLGADLLSELDTSKIDHIVEKGQDARVEMYSGFSAPFTNPIVSKSELSDLLRKAGVTDVYVVGLAFGYCVKCTAVDAAKEGVRTFVVRKGTRGTDNSEEGIKRVETELEGKGVTLISVDGPEVQAVTRRHR